MAKCRICSQGARQVRVEGLVGHEKHILDMFIMGRVIEVAGEGGVTI